VAELVGLGARGQVGVVHAIHDFARALTGGRGVAQATEVATAQLNSHANPWVWGRRPPPPRVRRRRLAYLL
jgi:hypothetical protein